MTKPVTKELLFLCFGNPARLDDGLGIRFGETLAKTAPAESTVEINYQLTLEDTTSIAEHQTVIFVDACLDGKEPFSFQSIKASDGQSFSTHSLRPEQLLYLAQQIFGARPQAYTLAIRGYRFDDFGEHLSTRAERNLEKALAFGRQLLISPPVRLASMTGKAATAGLYSRWRNRCKTENM